MWIAGAVLLAAGVVFFFLRWSQAAKLAQVLSAETLTCAGAERLCRDLNVSVGGPSGGQVEVNGVIEPRTPLKAELSGQECAAFKTRVEREWEEERWEADAKGEKRRTTQRGTETVSQNERLEPFCVRDESGRLLVDPQGAEVDWVQSVEKYEPGEPSGSVLSFGGFMLKLTGVAPGGRRTLGYRYKEWVLPAGRSVYVLGGTGLRAGEPCIQRPSGAGKRFLISLKSEEQIVAGARRAVLWLALACGACWLAGLALILVGLTRK